MPARRKLCTKCRWNSRKASSSGALEISVAALMMAQSMPWSVPANTDSPTVMEDCARAFPSVKLIERPEHLRDGHIPMNDVLLHDITQIEADAYLQTHSTNPLLRAETIDRAIRRYLDGQPEADSLFGVTKWQTRLYDASGAPINHDPEILARTQDLPPVFEENSNIYIFTADVLKTYERRIGAKPIMFEIDRLEAMDIDDEEGFQLAEAVAGLGHAGAGASD